MHKLAPRKQSPGETNQQVPNGAEGVDGLASSHRHLIDWWTSSLATPTRTKFPLRIFSMTIHVPTCAFSETSLTSRQNECGCQAFSDNNATFGPAKRNGSPTGLLTHPLFLTVVRQRKDYIKNKKAHVPGSKTSHCSNNTNKKQNFAFHFNCQEKTCHSS